MKLRAVILVGSVVALVLAADSGKESAVQGQSVLRVETRLVEVNVVAQDSKGRGVVGLRRDDFKLFDNGKEVRIDVFSALSAAIAPAPITLPPNTFSNRLQGAPPSVTVILLDGLNTNFEDQTWARTEVVRFLQELQPQDRVAMFLLGDHLYLLQNFTSDAKALLEVLKSRKARVAREVAASAAPEPTPGASKPVDLETALEQLNATLPSGRGGGAIPFAGSISGAAAQNAQAEQEAIMEQFETHVNSFFVRDRILRTVAALMALANYLAEFPGRKNLIWVSSAFPISIGFDQPRSPGDTRDQEHFTPELERACKALNNADLAVYPVDARGLFAGLAQIPMAEERSPGGRSEIEVNNVYSSHGTMDELADHTGGRAFYNTNDLARVVRTAVDDSHADYTLGFYPQNIRWDGKYHELKVKVTRPGIHLRYRKGYYAMMESPASEKEATALFNRVLYSPLDSTGMGLTVTVQRIVHEGPKRVELQIVMDPHDISFEDKDSDKMVRLEMLFAQSGADGKVLNAFRQTLTMRIAGKGMDVIRKRGLTLGKWLGLFDGTTTLELVVRDPTSGSIGSVRIPLGT